jgi:uncharacterized membrane protein
MKLKLSKSMTCDLGAAGTWGERAAAWMGLSFFLRMVYYFGFMNLKDVPTGEIVFSVVLALAISVAFILVLKLKKLNHALVAAGLSVAFAVNYFLTERMNFGGVVSAILVLAMAGMILAAVLGYIPERKWLLWTGMAVVAFRLLFVDVIGYILPLTELKLIAYIPRASNLFGVFSLASLCAALELKKAE